MGKKGGRNIGNRKEGGRDEIKGRKEREMKDNLEQHLHTKG